MVTIDRILCPVDFSGFSEHAFEHAIAIARWYKSAITVLHVVDVRLQAPDVSPLAPIALAPAALTLTAREQIASELRRLVDAAAATDVAIEAVVRAGRPDTVILEMAPTVAADLVVMGTHGRSGFDRLVMGSVTEKVLRKATCPVLSVPPRSDDSRTPVALKSILCPVDFCQSSMEALQCGVSLAEESDGHLTVLHVADALSPHDFPISELQTVTAFQAECDRRLRKRLADFVPGAARAYCTIEECVTTGKPWREILRVATEQHAELIVMGVRGRSSADVMLFGSTTHHVVRQATCPVLTLRG